MPSNVSRCFIANIVQGLGGEPDNIRKLRLVQHNRNSTPDAMLNINLLQVDAATSENFDEP